MCENNDITVRLNSWRGYSAYEVAVHNGYTGSEAEWLQSLRGADGRTTSVNGHDCDEQGAIVISGDDIHVTAGEATEGTLAALGHQMSLLAEQVTVTDGAVDVHSAYIDNARFR